MAYDYGVVLGREFGTRTWTRESRSPSHFYVHTFIVLTGIDDFLAAPDAAENRLATCGTSAIDCFRCLRTDIWAVDVFLAFAGDFGAFSGAIGGFGFVNEISSSVTCFRCRFGVKLASIG